MGRSSSNSPEFSRFREVSSIPEVSAERDQNVKDSFVENGKILTRTRYHNSIHLKLEIVAEF